jgi:hypothetical protein
MQDNNFSNSLEKWNELLLYFFIEEVCPVLVLSAHFDGKVSIRYIKGKKEWFALETE